MISFKKFTRLLQPPKGNGFLPIINERGVFMNHSFFVLMFFGTFLSAISQILLKKSAEQKHETFLKEYLNWRVITAYGIFFAVLLLNTYAYTRIDLKYGAVIDTFTYVFVLLLSVLLLHEKVSKRQLIGNLFILAGIFIYNL